MKDKIGFLAFHILFALCQILLPIFGISLVSAAFYIAGAVIIILGIISFFPGVKFWIESTVDGYNYEDDNIKTSLITLLVTVLTGCLIGALPHLFKSLGLFVPIFTYLISLFVGLKILSENKNWDYMHSLIIWAGKLVPCVYILAISIIILPALNASIVIHPAVQIILMSVASLFHIFRTVLVVLDDPF